MLWDTNKLDKLPNFKYKCLKRAKVFSEELKKECKMSKKCIYCKKEVSEDRAIDVCDSCAVGVWGHKMFSTIVKKTNDAKDNDDLVSTNTIGIQDFDQKTFK